jgi:hypothetical protein
MQQKTSDLLFSIQHQVTIRQEKREMCLHAHIHTQTPNPFKKRFFSYHMLKLVFLQFAVILQHERGDGGGGGGGGDDDFGAGDGVQHHQRRLLLQGQVLRHLGHSPQLLRVEVGGQLQQLLQRAAGGAAGGVLQVRRQRRLRHAEDDAHAQQVLAQQ